MTQELVQKALDALGQAMAKLADGAKYGYSIYVKQQLVSGIVNLSIQLIILITGLILTFFFVRKISKLEKLADSTESIRDKRDIEEDTSAYIIMVVFCIIIMIADVFFVGSSLKHIINPEYYALQQLLNMVTK